MGALETIRTLVTGAVRVWEEDGYICFSRFTEKQAALLKSRGFSAQMAASAGIRLEFLTNGGEISFDYAAFRGLNADFCGLTITADEQPIYHFYTEQLPLFDRAAVTVPSSREPVRVCIYFPNLAIFKMKNISLPQDSRPYKRPLKLLALGDSITHGAYSQHPQHTYAQILADRLHAEMLNQAIGGDSFFADNLDAALPFEPDIVTVAYGVNDWNGGKLFGDAAKQYFERLFSIYRDKKVFVLLPIWYQKEITVLTDTLEQGRAFIAEIAAQYAPTGIINCRDFVPHLASFYGDAELLHPNDFGHMYYGRQAANAIIKLL